MISIAISMKRLIKEENSKQEKVVKQSNFQGGSTRVGHVDTQEQTLINCRTKNPERALCLLSIKTGIHLIVISSYVVR